MSKIVKHIGNIYLYGQVGAGDSVAEQTTDCLSRTDALLREAGTDREHILQATIWLADMADFAEMNAIWDDWAPPGHAPSRLWRSQTGAGRVGSRNHHHGRSQGLGPRAT